MKFPMTQSFRLTQSFLDKYKRKKPKWGFNGLGEFVYMRTYSRILPNGKNEKWWQTVKRVVEGVYSIQRQHIDDYNLGWNQTKAQRSAQEMYDRIFNFKMMPPGRGLWAMGTDIIMERGLTEALFNCSYISTKNISDNVGMPFGNAMDFLMLGVGAGFDVQGAGTIDIKPQKETLHDYVIPDSREGWVESTIMLINSFFGGMNYIFDYSEIRPAGSPIKTFGGISAGAKPLIVLHKGITDILEKDVGNTISVRNISDIINMVGVAVVSGNVRRSAEIILGEPEENFLDLKNYEKNPKRKAFGWSSNNSIYATVGMDYTKIAERIINNGEPGLFWKENAQKYSRIRATEADWKDKRVEGLNPCGEITLEPSGLCNLVGLMPNNHEDLDDFKKTIKFAYLYAKTVTLLSTNWAETNKVMLRNRRIGLSMTGIAQFLGRNNLLKLKEWMREGYRLAKEYDEIYSDWFAIPKSKKLTTIKPSGCQVGKTLIPTSDGIVRLDELKQKNKKIWQEHNVYIYQEELNTKYESTRFFKNGFNKTKKIILDSGLSLESTLNHQYRIIRDKKYIWEKAENIVVGDIMPFKIGGYDKKEEFKFIPIDKNSFHKNNILIKSPKKMNKNIAWLLGLYYGDGSNHKKGIRIAGDISKLYDLEKANSIIREEFGINGIIYKRTKSSNNADLYVNSSSLLKFFEINKLLKQKSCNIIIPKAIRMSSKNSIIEFIDGYAHADGSFKTNNLSFVTVSKKWAEEFVIVARMVGYNAKFRSFYSKTSWGKKEQYWISFKKGLNAEERYIKKSVRNIRKQIKENNLENFDFDIVENVKNSYEKTFDIEVPVNNCYISNGYMSHNTVSLLMGATPGIHFPESQYYIRRVRLSANSPFIEILKNSGYYIEPAEEDKEKTSVVSFLVNNGDGVKTINDVSMWEQLNLAAFAQENWADNSVSVTITFKKAEKKDIASALDYYQFKLKSVSFLPKLKKGVYKQMPYEEITKEEYETAMKKIKPLSFSKMVSVDSIGEKYCTNDTCAV